MYHKKLNILIYTKDNHIEEVLRNVPAREHFFHVFLPASPHFSLLECSDADIIILDLPIQDISTQIRRYCAVVDPKVIYCDRQGSDNFQLEQSGLLDQIDDIWPLPCSDERLAFYFNRILRSIKLRKDCWMAQNYLDTAIDSVPDLIWFKDKRGAHLKVNQGFCNVVGKTKEQCRNRGHYYIWDMDAEEYSKGEYVCLESEEVVMREQKTCIFDEPIKGKKGMMQFKTYKSPVFDEDHTLIGTMGIARDVTDWKNVTAELKIILNSLVTPALIVGRDGKIIMANKALKAYFHVDDEDLLQMAYADWKTKKLCYDKEPAPGEWIPLEYERDGEIANLNIYEEPIMDVFQNVVGKCCLYVDVTEHKRHVQLLLQYQQQLSIEVRLKTKELRTIQKKFLVSFADMINSRDHTTGNHIRNTSTYVDILVEELRKDKFFPELQDENYCEIITQAAPMHDIGKMAIPDAILNKPGKYLPEEYEIMKQHAALGGEILEKTLAEIEAPRFYKVAWAMAVCHHEKWNGQGYPKGLKGTEIPLSARIMAVADVFDALIAERPYKKPFTVDEAYRIIIGDAGSHFDPAIVTAFIKARPRIEEAVVHKKFQNVV